MWRGHLIRPEQAISATLPNQKRHPFKKLGPECNREPHGQCLPGGRTTVDRGTGGLSTAKMPFPSPVVSGYGRTPESTRPKGLLADDSLVLVKGKFLGVVCERMQVACKII